MTEYTHVTLTKGLAATVVRVHNSNPLLDFWVARDHDSEEVEIAVSFLGASTGEKAVRLNPKQPLELGTTKVCDDQWRPAIEADHSQVTNALRRYNVMRDLLMLAIQD
jgi:hypothetical protein